VTVLAVACLVEFGLFVAVRTATAWRLEFGGLDPESVVPLAPEPLAPLGHRGPRL
jgi:hypothetical protein